ncbi:Bud-site selection protein [Suhomyces tanzawaensis NRRL Y-17324]|uniref:Bud-site selection protein n=1 Tax=Suhomyces tanzawaensis NRRL Y-17324 TaxID=984487 RepID=A0A1E4SF87_9ASCO|nr:Bud-site selection protein [Suhomyces tanzawaensis NRRL Y-17324]ODV78191.1 Bud-site selection protein [Suhomyces tanzawaensis NRRL Y-17324]
MKKNNTWKLDLLEVKFKQYSPRYPHTKKLLNARNNDKLLKKLPTSPEEAEQEILALKLELFERKYYGSYKKVEKEVAKITKADLGKLDKNGPKKSIVDFITSKENLDHLITSKLIKTITNTILHSKDLKLDPPAFISNEIRDKILNKNDISNPSTFFITHCQNNKELNNYFSNLWNTKAVKSVLQEVEWSFKLVRGNLTIQEKDTRKKITGKDVEADSDGEVNDDSSSDSDNEGDSEDEGTDSDIEMNPEDLDKFAIYENSDGASEEEQFEIDPNVNYNEITDEEPSADEVSDVESEDSFFEEDQEKKEKKEHNLPQLASGYFSGGSDDEDDFDPDADKVVKEATTQRKNRRGQRARQKIWALKYGKEAKHVKSEQAALASEREIRQKEYEERCRKRELKAKLAMEAAPSGSNILPLGERKVRPDTGSSDVKVTAVVPEPKIHPSWEAKRLAEEKLKNVKFEGKKIKFD